MIARRTATTLVAATLIYCFYAFAATEDAVPFPVDYRKWTHVKSALVGPESKAFVNRRGFHHFYANDKAVEGYRTGKFPDGSVIVDEQLQAPETAGITLEGPRVGIDVMLKDSQRYRETGGWGFEHFTGDNQSEGKLTGEVKAACFACHGKRKDRDFVFSELRK